MKITLFTRTSSDIADDEFVNGCQYMLGTKNISFATSGDIWDVMFDSIEVGSPGKAPVTNYDNVFELSYKKYDDEISARIYPLGI